MLVSSRRELERIKIGDNIIVKVLRINDHDVQIGIEAPKDVLIAYLDKEPKPSKVNNVPRNR